MVADVGLWVLQSSGVASQDLLRGPDQPIAAGQQCFAGCIELGEWALGLQSEPDHCWRSQSSVGRGSMHGRATALTAQSAWTQGVLILPPLAEGKLPLVQFLPLCRPVGARESLQSTLECPS